MVIREPFSAKWSDSMSLVEKVWAITKEQMMELAETIEVELRSECPKRSGEAARSIGIEQMDEYHIFVGGSNLHLYYADQGNGGSNRIITSTRAVDRKGRPPGKLRFSDGSFHTSAHGYKGKHFVKAVADRHR